MEGKIIAYGNRLWAFHTAKVEDPNECFILVGGLGDDVSFGLTDLGQAVHQACLECGYELVIPHLHSSGLGWGQSSLKQDAQDLTDLLNSLSKFNHIIMMGHSTGCQDLVYLGSQLQDPRVKLLILQAPVSDREMAFYSDPQGSEQVLKMAREIDGSQLLPKPWSFCGMPVAVTAYRARSLLEKGGDDDFFSTDLTPQERKMSNIKTPVAVIFGDEDGCFPHDERATAYLESLKAACPAIKSIHRLPGDHGLEGLTAEVCEVLCGLIRDAN